MLYSKFQKNEILMDLYDNLTCSYLHDEIRKHLFKMLFGTLFSYTTCTDGH